MSFELYTASEHVQIITSVVPNIKVYFIVHSIPYKYHLYVETYHNSVLWVRARWRLHSCHHYLVAFRKTQLELYLKIYLHFWCLLSVVTLRIRFVTYRPIHSINNANDVNVWRNGGGGGAYCIQENTRSSFIFALFRGGGTIRKFRGAKITMCTVLI